MTKAESPRPKMAEMSEPGPACAHGDAVRRKHTSNPHADQSVTVAFRSSPLRPFAD